MAVLQDHVYRLPVRYVDELRQRLIDGWSSMQQTVIDEAIDQWRIRLGHVLRSVAPETDTLNICLNVLLLYCWFIAYKLSLY